MIAATMEVKLAFVDDHPPVREGLMAYVTQQHRGFKSAGIECDILFGVKNGIELQEKLEKGSLPDVVLMDVNMPGMDGFETVKWLNINHPTVKVLIVSMIGKEETIMKMLSLGVKGYLSKDVEDDELREAIIAVVKKDFYYTEFVTRQLLHSLRSKDTGGRGGLDILNEREKQFARLACTDQSYNEIAGKMFVSPKTVEGYARSVCEKFGVKNRIALVVHLLRNDLVNLEGL
jgi:two-component system invasion response regulator UvrY